VKDNKYILNLEVNIMLNKTVKTLVIGTTGVLVGYKVYKKIRERQIQKITEDVQKMAEEMIQKMEEMEKENN
jgi:hypothetical protein